MKKILLLVMSVFSVIVSIAQTVVQPPTAVPDSGDSSLSRKIAVALVAIAIMAIIFYVVKKFNKGKKSSAK